MNPSNRPVLDRASFIILGDSSGISTMTSSTLTSGLSLENCFANGSIQSPHVAVRNLSVIVSSTTDPTVLALAQSFRLSRNNVKLEAQTVVHSSSGGGQEVGDTVGESVTSCDDKASELFVGEFSSTIFLSTGTVVRATISA